jgi:hypothetical protein
MAKRHRVAKASHVKKGGRKVSRRKSHSKKALKMKA